MTATEEVNIALDKSCLLIELGPQGSRLATHTGSLLSRHVFYTPFDSQFEVATTGKAGEIVEQTQVFETDMKIREI